MKCTRSPGRVQDGAAWDPLVSALVAGRPNGGTTWGTLLNIRVIDAKTWEIPLKTGVLKLSYSRAMSPFWSHVDPNLGRSCSQTDSTWGHVAACWTQVGAKLESSGSRLGPSWGLVGQWWLQVEPMLRTCGVETVHLEDVGPICKMCKLPQSRSGDLFVSLAAKRPCFGASGAGRYLRAFPIHACELIYICVFKYYIYIYYFKYYQISAFYIYHLDLFPAARMHHTHAHI